MERKAEHPAAQVAPRKRRRVGCIVLAGVPLLAVLMHLSLGWYTRSLVNAELRKLRAAGKPLTLAEIAPPPVPDEENAAPLYLKAADMAESPGWYEDPTYTPHWKVDWRTPEGASTLCRAIRNQEPAIELVREAMDRPAARFGIDWSDSDGSVMPRVEARSGMRAVARLTSAAAIAASIEGDRAEALERLRMGFSAARHTRVLATGMALFNAVAMDGRGAQSGEYVLREGPPPEPEARRLAEELHRLDYGEWLRGAVDWDRALCLGIFRKIRSEGLEYLDGIGSPGPLWVESRLFPAWFSADKLQGLGLYQQVEDDVCRPYRERRLAAPTSIADPPGWALVSKRLRSTAGVYRSFQLKGEIATARRRMLAAALGIEVYRERNGAFPEALADLEAMEWPMAPDPFSGEELVYRRTEAGFALYSIGPNLTDDSGTYPQKMRDRWSAATGDIVWGSLTVDWTSVGSDDERR